MARRSPRSIPWRSVTARLATRPRIDSRTSSVTANDASSHRLVTRLSSRVGRRCVSQRLCSVLTRPGRAAERIDRARDTDEFARVGCTCGIRLPDVADHGRCFGLRSGAGGAGGDVGDVGARLDRSRPTGRADFE